MILEKCELYHWYSGGSLSTGFFFSVSQNERNYPGAAKSTVSFTHQD
jgi:hypothetical protein